MSNKVVTLECLADQTLVKDQNGKKVKVKKGETFTTDSKTAETYLRVYRQHFALAGDDKTNPVDQEGVIELENRIDELETENANLKTENETLKAEVKEIQLETLRDKHAGKELKDIPYNDLRKIASLKGIDFDKTPKQEELVKAIKDFDSKDEGNSEGEK